MNATFERWYADLHALADKEGFELSSDVDSFKEYFDDGDSPEDVLKMERDHAFL